MKRCTRCILPATYRNIDFDRRGVCNYCRDYDRHREKLTDFARHRALLADRFDRLRGRFDYDVLVGVSGGKDSSYMAYTLKADFGLKVLTFTFDNGFLSDYARKNTALVVEKLGLDHFFHKLDWEAHRHFYRAALQKLGLPCLACSLIGYITMNKLAFERRIPFVVHGRSRAQMFKELADGSLDPFIPFIANNLAPYSVEANKRASAEALQKAMVFLNRVAGRRRQDRAFLDSAVPDIGRYLSAEAVPEFLGYFLFDRYDERAMMARLEKEIGWQRPGTDDLLTHADCLIHDAAVHLYQQVLGYPLLALELSVMIREGTIDREAALERLAGDKALNEPNAASYGVLCDRLGIRAGELPGIARKARLRHALLKQGLRARYLLGKPRLKL